MIKARRLTQREILFDLDQAVDACFAAEGKSAQFDRLSKTRSNLLRMWVETEAALIKPIVAREATRGHTARGAARSFPLGQFRLGAGAPCGVFPRQALVQHKGGGIA